jgi:general secretion pathway protein K
MVLWVSAALAAIGFSLASTVRGEVERTGTAVDGLRSYYLAIGGIQRGTLELLWSVQSPDKRLIPRGSTVVDYQFPSGMVRLEILPEAGKLDVNNIPVVELVRLLIALGEPQGQAQAIAMAIADWRGAGSGGGSLDGFYRAQVPSFQAPHASLQEIEELLLVRGVTPDLFYGTYAAADAADDPALSGPRLMRRGGLADCLSVYGARDRVDANTASPAVLAAIGLSPAAILALVQRRAMAPLKENELIGFMGGLGAPVHRLRVEGHSIVTMRATAQLRLPNGQLSDLKRTVGAQIKYGQRGSKSAYDVLRWYDTAWSN